MLFIGLLYYSQKTLRRKGGASDQGAVYIPFLCEFANIVRLDTASVKYSPGIGELISVEFGEPMPYEGMNLLSLLRRGIFSGSDRPDGLICYDKIVQVFP